MGLDLSAIKDLRFADPMPDLTKYPLSTDERLSAIEAKLAEFEDYFNTIESILTKIQAVYEAIKEKDHYDKLL